MLLLLLPGPALMGWCIALLPQVMDSHAWLKNNSYDRPNPSRMVHDVEISAGYMHSGYPVSALTLCGHDARLGPACLPSQAHLKLHALYPHVAWCPQL